MDLLVPMFAAETANDGETKCGKDAFKDFIDVAYKTDGENPLKALAAMRLIGGAIRATGADVGIRGWLKSLSEKGDMLEDLIGALADHIARLPKQHRSAKFLVDRYKVDEDE